MQLDLAEAEALLDKLANDFKDQDCNFYGIQDEKDELEEQYDELIDTYQRDQIVIAQQREILDQLEIDKDQLRYQIDEQERLLQVRDE